MDSLPVSVRCVPTSVNEMLVSDDMLLFGEVSTIEDSRLAAPKRIFHMST
jgi:hypothetical protein